VFPPLFIKTQQRESKRNFLFQSHHSLTPFITNHQLSAYRFVVVVAAAFVVDDELLVDELVLELVDAPPFTYCIHMNG
jgi:hypothetical protein